MGLRAEKKHRQREQLYEIAVQLFRDRGFERTRVHDIVELAHVSEPTFYNYFRTKEAVLDEVAARLLLDSLEGVTNLDPRRPVGSWLADLVVEICGALTADEELMRHVIGRVPLLGRRADGSESERDMYDRLVQLLRSSQDEGEIRDDLDALQLAATLTGAYQLIMLNWLDGWWEPRGDLRDRLLEAMDVFLNGCAADRAQASSQR